MEKQLRQYIIKIIDKHFNLKPKKITRMKTGLCNEVYLVDLGSEEVIVRLNKDREEIKGSEVYIPLFRSKGIKVPVILFSDYSKKFVPYYYQIQTKIDGEEINKVISKLTSQQLKGLAKEIANIFKKLLPIPTNGKFGYLYGEEKNLKNSLAEDILAYIKKAVKRGQSTGVLDDKEMENKIRDLFKQYKPYFDSVKSKFYYDDMSSKNIMVNKGKFSGLVDLDGVSYGDFLETVGRIKASWPSTKYGEVYTNAVMNELNLSKKQREIVKVYAILNRFFWMCENGIQFNQNTKAVVNQKEARRNRKIILDMFNELG